jgi:hypothetical protein
MTDWKPGDRVHHATFGDGTVLEANAQHITIHFDRAGRRKFAPHIVVLTESRTTDPASVRSGMARPVWPDGGAAARDGHVSAGRQASSPDTSARSATLQRGVAGVTGPSSIDELIDLARQKVYSEDSLHRFVSSMRSALAWRGHPHEGTLSGMRVMQFQNWMLDENPRWRLTDAQLLAVMRVEFPLATGLVHTGDAETGLSQMAGIRAHYNRDGHGGPSPGERGMPESVSYGRY